MPRKNKAAIPVEIVPRSRENMGEDFKRMIAQAIEEKVAEAMAHESDAAFQPFFQAKEIANAIKRTQTVHEQRKFVYYFEDYGCFVCETKDAQHRGLGMCGTCYKTRFSRLESSVRARTPPPEQQMSFMDTVRLARAALGPSIEILAAKALPAKRGFRNQKEAAREAGISEHTLVRWLKKGKVQQPANKLSATKWIWSDEDIERLRAFKTVSQSNFKNKKTAAEIDALVLGKAQ
jgi:hypothetical protein